MKSEARDPAEPIIPFARDQRERAKRAWLASPCEQSAPLSAFGDRLMDYYLIVHPDGSTTEDGNILLPPELD